MGNISNTRFPFGLTNVNDANLFADMVQPDPTLFTSTFKTSTPTSRRIGQSLKPTHRLLKP